MFLVLIVKKRGEREKERKASTISISWAFDHCNRIVLWWRDRLLRSFFTTQRIVVANVSLLKQPDLT